MRDWEHCWREGETPWERGEAAPPLMEYLEQRGEWLSGSRVLVPGCGSGHDVRALARHGARAFGLDLSATAVKRARAADPGGLGEYGVGDFFKWDGGVFDALWEHTCFCAIDPCLRGDYAAAARARVKPGGKLIGVFYLDPWEAGETPDPPPYGATREEIVHCLDSGFRLIWDRVPRCAYPGREGREWLVEFERREA